MPVRLKRLEENLQSSDESIKNKNKTKRHESMHPVSKHQIQPSMEMSRLTRDGAAEPVSRDQILRYERGQGNIHFSCSPDHVQDWQPYPVDPYSCYVCDNSRLYCIYHS